MALDFPSDNLTIGDTVELGGKTYQWDGVKWRMVYVITPTPPTPSTAAPTITIVTEAADGVTFSLTNNDDNTALISYEVDVNRDVISLAAAATSSNITVALSAGTYTLSAFATVVGEVATSATASVEIILPTYELLYEQDVATATTQIDITGLSIGKDDTLRLVYTFVGDSTTIRNAYISANTATTTGFAPTQWLYGSGSTVASLRTSDTFLAYYGSNRKTQGVADIKISNNDKVVIQNSNLSKIGAESNGMEQFNYNSASNATISTITSLHIISTAANSILTGSKIALYKVTEAA